MLGVSTDEHYPKTLDLGFKIPNSILSIKIAIFEIYYDYSGFLSHS